MTYGKDSTGYSRRLVKIQICFYFVINKIFFFTISANVSHLRGFLFNELCLVKQKHRTEKKFPFTANLSKI
jgi:hypothetical protein